jgi:hypothetical protein
MSLWTIRDMRTRARTIKRIAASPLGISSPVTRITGAAFRVCSKWVCMKPQNQPLRRQLPTRAYRSEVWISSSLQRAAGSRWVVSCHCPSYAMDQATTVYSRRPMDILSWLDPLIARAMAPPPCASIPSLSAPKYHTANAEIGPKLAVQNRRLTQSSTISAIPTSD